MTHFIFISTARLLLLSCALFTGMAQSQPRPATAPEALKDIQPAGQACLRNEAAIKPNLINGRAASVPDMTCLIVAQEAGLLVKAGQVTVVDTRTSLEHAQFHINSALNMPTAEVIYKTQLRNKPIVLVGNGKLDRELYSTCTDLKAKGFNSVKVLQGGMPAWVASGQSVIGNAPSAQQLRRLESSDLFAESQFAANLLVVTPSEAPLQSQFGLAVAAAQDTPDALKQLLDRRRLESKGAVNNAVVLVTSPKTSQATLAQWQKAADPLPLLVYSEGTVSYQRYLADQKAVWVAQAQGPKQPACGQ